VQAQFDDYMTERLQHGLDHWQQSFELQRLPTGPAGAEQRHDAGGARRRDAVGRARTRGCWCSTTSPKWCRRSACRHGAKWRAGSAHEIKNPLTPIQLSAERLAHKLSGNKLPPASDQALLRKSVQTIVDQVDAMKRLVNEFRDYARLPAADLKPIDLNSLVADVLSSMQRWREPAHPAALRARPERCPPVLGDRSRLRQVIHNLVQNAQDAAEAAASGTGKPGEVVIRTRLERGRPPRAHDGAGQWHRVLQRTSSNARSSRTSPPRTKGTGLGLAVVKKIADEHGARIDVKNRVEGAWRARKSRYHSQLASEPRAAVAHTEDSKSSAA
jgi:light-regulated signal transduction histidine kinase (bacteriophytochrome)